jgi:hypothetical protein
MIYPTELDQDNKTFGGDRGSTITVRSRVRDAMAKIVSARFAAIVRIAVDSLPILYVRVEDLEFGG